MTRADPDATPASLVATAFALHQAGRLAEARPVYERALAARPDDADALYGLGVLRIQEGALDDGIALLERATARRSDHAASRIALGRALARVGRLAEASEALAAGCALPGADAGAFMALGASLAAQARLAEAAEALGRAASLDPHNPTVHNEHGGLLHDLGRLDAAEAAYRRALAVAPDFVPALGNLGICLQAQSRLDEAASVLERAVALAPDDAAARSNLGTAYQAVGRLDEAIAAFERAVALAPADAEFHSHVGNALLEAARLDAALAAHDRAAALAPGSATVHNNRALALKEKGRAAEAEEACRRALALDPGLAAAHANLGNFLYERARFDEACAAYDRAIALGHWNSAGLAAQRALLLPPIIASVEAMAADRARYAAALVGLADRTGPIADPLRQIGYPGFYLPYMGQDDRSLQEALARFYRAVCPALVWTAPHCRPGAARTAGRIRVGVLSLFLRDHTIGRLTQGLIERMPRGRIELVVLRPPGPEDAVSRAIDTAADQVIRIAGNLWPARETIAAARLDVLFFTDIGMAQLPYFLAHARLAPVQCTTWGHPVTTGIPTMDYFLSSDGLEPEGAEAHYSERLVRLPTLPTCYLRPVLPETVPARADYGLPDDATLYGCPQTLFKFHPDFDPMLVEILRRDPSGLLVMIAGPDPHWDETLARRITRLMPEARARIRFLRPMKRDRFVALLSHFAVSLDPFPFGSGNSTYEALAMGTPVITLPGAFMRGRVTAALYREMGVDDCIARDASDYVARALAIARDPARRATLSTRIRAAAPILFERGDAVAAIEDFFVTAHAAATSRDAREVAS